MKKIFLALLASLSLAGPAWAAGAETIPWDRFDKKRITDMAALQNGAKIFANHCLNCHAATFMRFNRLRDIGLTEEQIKANLIFTDAKVGETMTITMDPKDAKDWFGGVPPDLTLIARSRSAAGKGTGADYLYTFLRNYYRDDTKVTGWNNKAFPNVGMPHVLWDLQGQQRPIYAEKPDPVHPGKTMQVFTGSYEMISPGKMTPEEYNLAIADLVAFLQWMGEPNQRNRVQIGVWVMLFLGVFTVIAWRLNAAFWKDVK